MATILLVARKVSSWFTAISRGLFILAGAAIWILMGLTIVGVIMRYLVKKPFIGAFEASESYLLVGATVLALAMVQHERRHIQIQALTERLTPRGKLIFDFIVFVIALGACGLISYSAWPLLLQALSERIRLGGMAGLPLWPARAIFFLGFTWLGIEFLKDLVMTVHNLVTGKGAAK